MQIRNPCKKCLVQPICTSACNTWYNYKYYRGKFRDWISPIILLLIGLEMVVWITDNFKAPQAGIISVVLFAFSLLQAWCVTDYRKIIKHQNKRFGQGDVTVKMNLKPKPSSASSTVSKTNK